MTKRKSDEEKPSNTPRVALFGLVRIPGKGYSTVEVRVPQAVIERFAADDGIGEPEILEIALSRVERSLRREVM